MKKNDKNMKNIKTWKNMIKNDNKTTNMWKIAIFHVLENFCSTGSTNDKKKW